MKTAKIFAVFIVLTLVATFIAGAADAKVPSVKITQKWNGDYPVAQLDLLPQKTSPQGYFGDAKTFEAVWNVFKPKDAVPGVNFEKEIVVFSRNVQFYNRTHIMGVEVKDGVAKIAAVETRSAIPIGDKVAMALAVIPREGVKFIEAGGKKIPVAAK